MSEKCRMCGEHDESIFNLVSECKKLAQPDYKQRHDSIAGIVHLEQCQLLSWSVGREGVVQLQSGRSYGE